MGLRAEGYFLVLNELPTFGLSSAELGTFHRSTELTRPLNTQGSFSTVILLRVNVSPRSAVCHSKLSHQNWLTRTSHHSFVLNSADKTARSDRRPVDESLASQLRYRLCRAVAAAILSVPALLGATAVIAKEAVEAPAPKNAAAERRAALRKAAADIKRTGDS